MQSLSVETSVNGRPVIARGEFVQGDNGNDYVQNMRLYTPDGNPAMAIEQSMDDADWDRIARLLVDTLKG